MTKQQTPTYPRGGATGNFHNAKPNVTDRRKNMKYKVSTTSTTASGVVPIRGATKYPAQPSIYFTREAWVKQCHLVDKCTKEVGWFAMVDYDENDNSFTITELVIPSQTVTSAETDIGKEDLADAAMELIEQGKDTSKLYAWFHSHVNMGVGPSPQDEFQVEDYLEDLADQPEVPAFIRGIQNKKGDLKLDVYYVQHGVAYQNLDFFVIHDDDPQWLVDIEAEIKTKVTERSYGSGYYWGGEFRQYGGSGGSHQKGGKSPANGNARSVGNSNAGYDNDRFAMGFRNGPYDYYDDYYDDWDTVAGYVNRGTGELEIEDEDTGVLPLPLKMPNAVYNSLEQIYQSKTENVEVMADEEGQLYVCGADGEIYDYNEYTECYGEIDGSNRTLPLVI